jgi:acetyl-CoA synthetase
VSETHAAVQSAYPPSSAFAAQANATEDLYRQAEQDRLAFWAERANRLSWDTPFTKVLDWSGAPFARRFIGGKLNVAYNCVDRHVEAGNGGPVAIYWEGEGVRDSHTITYSELLAQVCKAANALTDLGLVAGDRVAIYMPMVPEAVISMLACAELKRLRRENAELQRANAILKTASAFFAAELSAAPTAANTPGARSTRRSR